MFYSKCKIQHKLYAKGTQLNITFFIQIFEKAKFLSLNRCLSSIKMEITNFFKSFCGQNNYGVFYFYVLTKNTHTFG